ncbi:D-glutamate deacylase [Alteromonas sediminis]|uniref:D-glutamate deacylase n=1 Tax=Alteromonas sediminis TaxID=2259342 RepID=A0A3N5Y0K3_9ALTE|nr:amidohydrolase family protein [Alteromonas sediminis]RPJ66992.1 D-glutamate deacylase [Alteromonas sediminis]
MRINKVFKKVFTLVSVSLLSFTSMANMYDLVIENGRVIDPETGLDAVRNLGITAGKISAVTTEQLSGSHVINAQGKIVSPGFIDMHAHGQDILSGRVQAYDGVTTALELEGGMLPVSDYYDAAAREGRPINYGASVNWGNARIATMLNVEPVADIDWFLAAFSQPDWQFKIANKQQLNKIEQLVAQGLDQGGLGIGILMGYAPGTGYKEFFAMNKLAASRGVPTFTHARYLSMLEPRSSFQGINEIIAAASGTGAHTHIVHLNSISLRDIATIGDMIETARSQGLRITTEAYPYGAGATGIGAAMFRGDRWRERTGGISARNFDVDGKRLTEEEFDQFQSKQPNTKTIVHFLEEDNSMDMQFLEQSLLFPEGVIASDGGDWRFDGASVSQETWPLPDKAWSHPRSAGTYAKFIGTFVRDKAKISLIEAIKRVSFGPAKLLQDAVPQMKYKGRIQVGADADIVIFDLDEIRDRATYVRPAQLSQGIEHVIVNGTLLIEYGQIDLSVLPGQPIRNPIKNEPTSS